MQSANAWFYSYDCQTVPITTLLSEPWDQCWPYSLWGGLRDVPLHVLNKPVVWQRTENQCNENKATDMNLTGNLPHLTSQLGCPTCQVQLSVKLSISTAHGSWHPRDVTPRARQQRPDEFVLYVPPRRWQIQQRVLAGTDTGSIQSTRVEIRGSPHLLPEMCWPLLSLLPSIVKDNIKIRHLFF